MSSPLVTIQADEALGAAALLMLERKIRRVPVVDEGRIAGIVTEKDLSRATLNTIMSLSSLGQVPDGE
jgi:acetoin utilization protein AcuB